MVFFQIVPFDRQARLSGNTEEIQENAAEPPHSRRSSLSLLQEDLKDIRDPTSTQRLDEISGD